MFRESIEGNSQKFSNFEARTRVTFSRVFTALVLSEFNSSTLQYFNIINFVTQVCFSSLRVKNSSTEVPRQEFLIGQFLTWLNEDSYCGFSWDTDNQLSTPNKHIYIGIGHGIVTSTGIKMNITIVFKLSSHIHIFFFGTTRL